MLRSTQRSRSILAPTWRAWAAPAPVGLARDRARVKASPDPSELAEELSGRASPMNLAAQGAAAAARSWTSTATRRVLHAIRSPRLRPTLAQSLAGDGLFAPRAMPLEPAAPRRRPQPPICHAAKRDFR